MFKKINHWLIEHVDFWPWDEREGRVCLWFWFVTIVLTFVWHYTKWDWKYLWQGLAGISCFGTPILAAIIALIKRQKWNPWFWFPSVIGVVFGGFLMFIIFFTLGWASL